MEQPTFQTYKKWLNCPSIPLVFPLLVSSEVNIILKESEEIEEMSRTFTAKATHKGGDHIASKKCKIKMYKIFSQLKSLLTPLKYHLAIIICFLV